MRRKHDKIATKEVNMATKIGNLEPKLDRFFKLKTKAKFFLLNRAPVRQLGQPRGAEGHRPGKGQRDPARHVGGRHAVAHVR